MKKWLLILGMITCMLGLTACGAEKEAETPVLSEAEADELGRQIVEDVNQYVVMGAQAQAPNQLIADAIASWESSADDMGDYVEVISTIRAKYPDIHITAAVSNISFNLPVRKMINLGFTVLAMNAGLDSAILDPTNRDMMGVIYATEALLGQDDYCMEYISAYRERIFGPKK